MALNPIRFAHQVNEQFRRYQLTAFPLADPDLASQARELLGSGGFGASPLVRGPYLSLARAFETGDSIQALIDRGVLHPALAGIAEHPTLFRHQQETLEAVKTGYHALVTTGTGSGKTEAFLYPILHHCLALRDADAPPGVTAILIYPMNALAADQRDRLRDRLAGTGITFGMYVGSTPHTPSDARVLRLKQGEGRSVLEQERRKHQREGTAVVPHEECASEEEIAERKPRLLITNANQLEILLTRGRDLGLFEEAPLRFIVLDEAHTYSGAAGAEVACLMRRLRTFAGKGPDDVTCLATSATIVDPESGGEVGPSFLSRLFGVPEDWVRVVVERYVDPRWKDRRTVPGPPADPEAVLDRVLAALDRMDEDPSALAAAVEDLTGVPLSLGDGAAASLHDHLSSNEAVRVFGEELVHPLHLDRAVRTLWARLARRGEPAAGAGAEVLAYLALGAAAERDGAPLLRPKMHVFVRGLEGAHAVFSGAPPRPRLYFSIEEARKDHPERQPTAIFPVSVCRTCGQHYFTTHLADFSVEKGQPQGGQAEGTSVVWRPVPGEEAGTRFRFTDRFLVEIDAEEGAEAVVSKTEKLWLCVHCGTFQSEERQACAEPSCSRPGPLTKVQVVVEGKRFTCPGCGAIGGQFGSAAEPIRPLRASSVADVHILAQEMVSAASPTEQRLLVFADNRQDAAFQAGWMRDHARRYRLRYLMLEAIREAGRPLSVGDAQQALYARLAADPDLARALAPEAFSSESDEAFGQEQKRTLRRFLRIQVLRELAATINQRESLERWGKVRVGYAGVDAGAAPLQGLAHAMDMNVDDVVDGVASLLDVWRRQGILHDPDDPIYSQWWSEGAEEILRGIVPAALAANAPLGVKLERTGGDERVRQLLSAKGLTHAMGFVAKWKVADTRAAIQSIWDFLLDQGLVVPVTLLGRYQNKALPETLGAYQVNTEKIGILGQHERYRCGTCQRVHARPSPGNVCTKHRCGGTLIREEPPADDYNVAILARPFSMVMAEEHSAQVPHETREEIEREFKREGGRVNTLVATPTLELGVDIGDLDLVLLRNVPPTTANYWQRVGRAGRRRRMAVLYTYCRRVVHDAYFFEDPARLLGARVRPPRFNLKNDVMVRKHVHATVLSELLRLERRGLLSEPETAELRAAFPPYVREYLFEGEENRYRTLPPDLSGLGRVISAHRGPLVAAVERVFARHWPAEAQDEVAPERLAAIVEGMDADLQAAVARLHQRLLWTLRTMQGLLQKAAGQILDPDEDRQLDRCKQFVARLKDAKRETYTLSVLAVEGFLPGYGIYEGGIVAFAGRRSMLGGPREFQLSRASALAVREFVPGNLIYANRGRFRAARYHFPIDRDLASEKYVLDPEALQIVPGGTSSGYREGGGPTLEAIPICDLDLAHLGPIRDEELERFQMPVLVLGTVRRLRRGGVAYRGGAGPVHHLLGQGLRLVNFGPGDRVRKGMLGYPLCRVCGAARSPYSSEKELTDFAKRHKDRCGREPALLGFFADVQADNIAILELASQVEAVNLGEALRIGAAQVLEMEVEDLHTLIGRRDEGDWELYLYDPMPGGSGLLDQILERWEEIVRVLQDLLEACPGACEASCYECLRTGRNTFYHRLLDRHAALEVVERYAARPVEEYTLGQLVDSGREATGEGTHRPEDRLAELLDRAGFPAFTGQMQIELGPPFGRTVPDFGYEDADAGVKIAVYLDGLSKGLHGDPKTARQDAILRGQLEDRDWRVVELAASHLDDPEVLMIAFKKIARALGGKERADALAGDPSWAERAGGEAGPAEVPGPEPLRIVPREEARPYETHVPVYSLAAAAGSFLENRPVEEEGWVEAPGVRLREGMFAARVRGRSMEPRIPDGSLVLFRRDVGGGPLAGARGGRIVLAALRGPEDPENGGAFTVKRFRSVKRLDEEGQVARERIVLESLNPEVPDIELTPGSHVEILAEYVKVLR